MDQKDNKFEVGGFAKHIHINKGKELYIVNITDKEVLTRYESNYVFYTQSFFKFELEPIVKKTSIPLARIRM